MEELKSIDELLFAEDVEMCDAIPLKPVGPAVSTVLELELELDE